MRPSGGNWQRELHAVSVSAPNLLTVPGCGPAVPLIMSVAGSVAAVSGEPQRTYNMQGQDFDEQRIAILRTGTHTSDDVVNLLGRPQTKIFTNGSEE